MKLKEAINIDVSWLSAKNMKDDETARNLKYLTFNHGVQGSNSRGLTTLGTGSNIFNYLRAVLSSMVALLDNFCSLFRPLANACSASRA